MAMIVAARALVGDGHTTNGRVDKGECGKAVVAVQATAMMMVARAFGGRKDGSGQTWYQCGGVGFCRRFVGILN